MRKLMIILVVLFLYSCVDTDNEIYYTYKDTVIKRIDKPGETSFYYMNKDNTTSYRIWAEYSGINSGFQGYLKFNDCGEVTLLSGNGYYQCEDVNTQDFVFRSISACERPEDIPSVYYINISTAYEIERNAKTTTKVKAVYKKI